MDWRAVVGGNVRRLRLQRGLTQEQLAFEAQLDLTYVGGIERGRRNPSLLVLVRIADVLGLAPAELLQRHDFGGQQRNLG
jgi:transcriptional regulator with XRE-family HTH domain